MAPRSGRLSRRFPNRADSPFSRNQRKPAAERSKPKGTAMKNRSVWAGAVALAVTLTSQLDTRAEFTNWEGIVITNGVIVITTRSAQDAFWRQQSTSGLWDADDNRGPGVFSPGDAEMGNLLMSHG